MAIRKATEVTVDQTRVATDAKPAPTFTEEEMALSAVPSLRTWLGGTTAVPIDGGGTDVVVDGWDTSVNGWRNRLAYEDEIWTLTNPSVTKPTVVDTFDGKKGVRSAATQVSNAFLGPDAAPHWTIVQPWTLAFIAASRPTATGLLFGSANPAAGTAYWGFASSTTPTRPWCRAARRSSRQARPGSAW